MLSFRRMEEKSAKERENVTQTQKTRRVFQGDSKQHQIHPREVKNKEKYGSKQQGKKIERK